QTGSDIVLDFTLGIDEVSEVRAYPKTNKTKSKSIVLARGNKDSKTLDFLSSSLEKILSSDFTEAQRDYFFKSAKKEIEQINSLGTDNHDSEKWDEIGTTIFTTYERASEINDSIDEEELSLVFASILISEYPDLIGDEHTSRIKSLLAMVKNDDDPLEKIQAMQKLKVITDEYPILITLFTVKMSSDNAAKESPS